MSEQKSESKISTIILATLSIICIGAIIGVATYFVHQKMPIPIVKTYFTAMLECDIKKASEFIHPDCEAFTCKQIRESSQKYTENCKEEKQVTQSTIQSLKELNRTVDELFYVEIVIDSEYIGNNKKVKHREVNRKYIVELKKDDGDWKILGLTN